MAIMKPFRAVRPSVALVKKVSSLPYDVMNRQEAKAMADGNEYSFLHIVRSEIDIDDSVSQYDESVYLKAKSNLAEMIDNGILVQDKTAMFYIYRQVMQGRVQTGIVGCASIDDYLNDVIKKHERTREAKEADRINHFDFCNAHTEPVFLTFKKSQKLSAIIEKWIYFNDPEYSFESEDGIRHIFWPIKDTSINSKIQEAFASMECLYIADGHHRSASSAKVGLKRREASKTYTGEEEFNFFLTVAFPDEDLYIMDYNRVVKDLNGHTNESFLTALQETFSVEKATAPYQPSEKHTFGMYLDNQWYKLTAKDSSFDAENTIDQLDVSIMQNNILAPILGISNPRTDERIDFVGGIRGLAELESRVSEDMSIAFSMYPTTIEDLMNIADLNLIMPPKSTWFEPKLRSGLFLHKF